MQYLDIGPMKGIWKGCLFCVVIALLMDFQYSSSLRGKGQSRLCHLLLTLPRQVQKKIKFLRYYCSLAGDCAVCLPTSQERVALL